MPIRVNSLERYILYMKFHELQNRLSGSRQIPSRKFLLYRVPFEKNNGEYFHNEVELITGQTPGQKP